MMVMLLKTHAHARRGGGGGDAWRVARVLSSREDVPALHESPSPACTCSTVYEHRSSFNLQTQTGQRCWFRKTHFGRFFRSASPKQLLLCWF